MNIYLVVSREISRGEEGGVSVYSLADPVNPKRVAYWSQEEPRDLCFCSGSRENSDGVEKRPECIVVPCSGSGVYLLEWSAKTQEIKQSAHFYLQWPSAGKHGGYPVCASASATRVFIGTTGGNNPECEDFSCPYRGARVYEVKLP